MASSSLICFSPLLETYMVPSVVKEASGLFTIKSTLYMQPTKADKDSVFQCTVEYSMPGDQIKQKMSDTININLNCEWRRKGRGPPGIKVDYHLRYWGSFSALFSTNSREMQTETC